MAEPINVFNDNISNIESFDYDSMSISDKGTYNYCKQLFIEEIRRSLLSERQYWLGNLGYLEAKIGDQGSKSTEVIKNIRFTFKPNDKFKFIVKKELFTRHGIDLVQKSKKK